MPPSNFQNCYPYAQDGLPHLMMPRYQEQYYDEKPVQADRYKTRLCDKFFETNGRCPYGMRCMFAHGEHELRTVEDNLRDGLVSEGAIRRFRQRYYLHSFKSYPSCSFTPSLVDLSPPPSYDSVGMGSWEGIANSSASCCPSFPPPPPYEESVEKYHHNPYQSVLDDVDEFSTFSSSVTSMEESENSQSSFFPTGHLSSPSSCSESLNEGEWKNEVNSLSREVAVMSGCA